MSHPVPGHDYSEQHKHETHHEYSKRRGEALGKVEHLPKGYVVSRRTFKRGMKSVHRQINSVTKALGKAKE